MAETLTVEQRLSERIKEQLPALLSDADLQELVKRTVNDVFFNKRQVPDPYGRSWEKKDIPPLLHDLTKELLSATVSAAISAWLEANKELVAEQMAKALQNGIGGCVLESLNHRFETELWTLQSNLREKGLLK